jgi:hypothetical protein
VLTGLGVGPCPSPRRGLAPAAGSTVVRPVWRRPGNAYKKYTMIGDRSLELSLSLSLWLESGNSMENVRDLLLDYVMQS